MAGEVERMRARIKHWFRCGWLPRPGLRLAAVGAIVWLLAGCGAHTQPALPSLPGGTYTDTQFYLNVAYPPGWQANIAPDSSPTIPLTVIFTRSGEAQTGASIVSNVTIAVFNAKDPNIASTVSRLTSDTKLHRATIGGWPGYTDQPVTQPILNTSVSDTHTDYYVVAHGYEYQITTDALSTDTAASAIDQILHSLQITK